MEEGWKEVSSQRDIEELLGFYAGFHDSCIVSVNYRSGAFVDGDEVMHMGSSEGHELRILFHSQWGPEIELCFLGLRQLHLTGWQDNYLNDIFGAHLAFYDGLLPGTPERVILWADNEDFKIENIHPAFHEPSDTYLAANALRWRITGETGGKVTG